ncbi:hypothetical protein P4O66_009591 [Electrophorus voltai]|uniref:ribonuclease H n=1 Tax=Electrophorus voltai TaxID=2609070 RepID=A0AAD8ZBZ3_9TELE|nr:hypothetical protein P4O66_009591 [Electrophorus voltai]
MDIRRTTEEQRTTQEERALFMFRRLFHASYLQEVQAGISPRSAGADVQQLRRGMSGKLLSARPSATMNEPGVLPYGLATAPSIFQAYIKEVLREYLGRSVVAYINDILSYSSNWNQYVLDERAVLQTLLRNHLYCKAEK